MLPIKSIKGVESKKKPGGKLEEENDHELRVIHVPVILFREISQALGMSDPREIYTRGGKYTLIELKPDHQNTGFQGAIGLQVNEYTLPRTEFVLWEKIPEGKPDNVFEPDYALRIIGRSTETGAWTYGRGNLLKEEVTAELKFSGGISIRSPAAKLIAYILYRAHLLTQDSSFQAYKFWQSQVWPEGEYTKP